MQTLKETLERIVKDLKNRQIDSQDTIFEALKSKLSKQELAHIKNVSFFKGMLSIKVDSSAWLYQLSQKKEQLKDQLGISNINMRIVDTVENEKKKRHTKEKRRVKKS